MRSNACQNIPGSYPATLAAAFRVASSWKIPMGEEQHSAFFADNTPVTKSKPYREKRSLEDIECFVCGKVGHYARNCNMKKGGVHFVKNPSD
jgi:Zinc knuckle